HHFALAIHHDHAIAIAVECNAQVCPQLPHFFLQGIGMSGSAIEVDIEAIGLNTHRNDLRSQLLEHRRTHAVGGAVGAVQHYSHTVKGKVTGKGALAELDVATPG